MGGGRPPRARPGVPDRVVRRPEGGMLRVRKPLLGGGLVNAKSGGNNDNCNDTMQVRQRNEAAQVLHVAMLMRLGAARKLGPECHWL